MSAQPKPSRPSVSVAVTVVLGCLMLPTQLDAQTAPTVELAGGVGAVAAVELFPSTVPADWLASVAWNVGDGLALVGEVARLPPARHDISTRDIYTLTIPCEGAAVAPPPYIDLPCGADGTVQVTGPGQGERQVNISAFLIGPRFTLRSSRFKPFVHILFGAARVAWDAALELPPGAVRVGEGTQGDLDASDLPLTSQTTSITFQIGAGLDIPLWNILTARFAADRRQLVDEPLFSSQFRVSAQLVVALGNR